MDYIVSYHILYKYIFMHSVLRRIQKAPVMRYRRAHEVIVSRTYSVHICTYIHTYRCIYLSCLCLFSFSWIFPASLYRLYRKVRSFWISCALRVALLNPHSPFYISYIAESNALLIRRRAAQLTTDDAASAAVS